MTSAMRERVAELLDEAFAAEIKRVSSVEYNSNEICRHFYGELRKRFFTYALATPDAGDGDEITREAWAIVRPDGETIHPESVRGSEHAAQWSIGNWAQMERDGFTCRRVNITAPPPSQKEGE